MKVKRFEAPTIQEAIKQVKKTLGPDAVILSVKEIKKNKGILGFLNKSVEVTAAVDTLMSSKQPRFKKEDNIYEEQKKQRFNSVEMDTSLDLIKNIEDLSLEIKKLKALIRTFLPTPAQGKSDLEIFNFCREIKGSGLAEEIALKLIEGFRDGIMNGAINEEMTLRDFLTKLLISLIKVLPPLENSEKEQKAVAFIGPTGTGKTTTLAKIAGNLIKAKKQIGVVTIDTRLPGREQLKFYAKELGFPLEIAITPKELAKTIEKFTDKDVILIDTGGCSPYNEFQIKDLSRYFRQLSKPVLNYLVLSITTKEDILLKTSSQFEVLSIDSLLFTKLDEVDTFGTIFNQMVYTGKPISYFTTGQQVPQDIEHATPERVIELIINTRGENNDVERSTQVL